MLPDPNCAAARHGTMSAYYRAGCRCPDARRATALYTKRRRTGRPELRRVAAVGARRRIQALMALGHRGVDIAEVAGMHPRQVQLTAVTRRWVSPVTHARIVAAYEALSGRPGVSEKTRQRARRAGWAPPLAWEFVDIDDPLAEPEEMLGRHLRSVPTDLVDDIAVERAANGDRSVRLNRPEREAAIRLMASRGVSPSRIGLVLGVQHKIVMRVLGREVTRHAA